MEIFSRGVTPLEPLEKIWSVIKKNKKNIFAPDPQFLFYNIKVLYAVQNIFVAETPVSIKKSMK